MSPPADGHAVRAASGIDAPPPGVVAVLEAFGPFVGAGIQALPWYASHRAWIVEFDAHVIFVKQVDEGGLSDDADRLRKEAPLLVHTDESWVYQNLLAECTRYVPHLYAHVETGEGGTFLLLEWIVGRELGVFEFGDRHWVEAARMLRYLGEYLSSKCLQDSAPIAVGPLWEPALDNAGQLSAGLRNLLSGHMGQVLRALEEVDGGPHRIVHGQAYSRNIMVRDGGPGNSVVLVDWETCRVGPWLFDLASLCAGWGHTGIGRRRMVDAFLGGDELACERTFDRFLCLTELAHQVYLLAILPRRFWTQRQVRNTRAILDRCLGTSEEPRGPGAGVVR